MTRERTPAEAMQAVQAAFADASELVVLITGQDAEGRDFWAFVLMDMHGYAKFQRAREEGGELSDFGRILEHGVGAEPPVDVVARMQADYGFDPGQWGVTL